MKEENKAPSEGSHANKTEAVITQDSMSVDLYGWTKRIIEGTGGFKTWEDRECVVHHVSREYSIAAFVIRCLANKECEGSEGVLDAILFRRQSLNSHEEPSPVSIGDSIESKLSKKIY